MVVNVKLFATLRRHYPDLGIGEPMPVELPEGATVGHLLARLRPSAEEIKIVFVNHVVRREEFVLSDGDVVGIFPHVGGG